MSLSQKVLGVEIAFIFNTIKSVIIDLELLHIKGLFYI